MSRGGFKRGKKLPGAEFSYQTEPGREPDTAPTPLFPVSQFSLYYMDENIAYMCIFPPGTLSF